jgi:hypothetical protein
VIFGIVFSVLPTSVFAQAPAAKPAPPSPPPPPPAAATTAPPAAAAGADAPATNAPAAAPTTDPRVTGNLGGHTYSDKPVVRTGPFKRAKTHRATGPLVNLPGFEQLTDGGSRLFVQLSQSVPVEERRAQSSITYILKGAHARVWNNTNPLVTVHFSTPVSSARLVPHGNDLHFVVDLRAAAQPTWKMTEGADKTSMLTIDFPKGDYGGAPSEENLEKAKETTSPKGKLVGKRPVTKPAEPPPAPGPTP